MKKQNDQTKRTTAEEMPDADFVDVDDAIRLEQPKASRMPHYLSLLAVLLSGIAAIGMTFVALRPARSPEPAVVDTTALDALAENLRSNEDTVNRLQLEVNELADIEAAAAEQQEDLQREWAQELESKLEVYESLPGRLSKVEDTVSLVQGISTGVRDNWLLAEAEYYLQIANAQLQLAGNPHLARLALLQADKRIGQLADPALTHVRRALSGELRALNAMHKPDIEGMTLTLASLADTVESLPIRHTLELPAATAEKVGGELSGIDRAIASLKSTVGDVVSVRRSNESLQPLIAPEAVFFLRANLSLQLQVARLALLRGEKAAFRQSLDDAANWLDEYYDTGSIQVQSARQTIVEVSNSLPDVVTPDISESLRLLRQHGALSSVPAETNDFTETLPQS